MATPENGEVKVRAAVAGRVNTLLEAKKVTPGGEMTVVAMDELLRLISADPSALEALFSMQSEKNGVVGNGQCQ